MNLDDIRTSDDLVAYLATHGIKVNEPREYRATPPGLYHLGAVLDGVTLAQARELRAVVLACARAYGAEVAWAVTAECSRETGDPVEGTQEVEAL